MSFVWGLNEKRCFKHLQKIDLKKSFLAYYCFFKIMILLKFWICLFSAKLAFLSQFFGHAAIVQRQPTEIQPKKRPNTMSERNSRNSPASNQSFNSPYSELLSEGREGGLWNTKHTESELKGLLYTAGSGWKMS